MTLEYQAALDILGYYGLKTGPLREHMAVLEQYLKALDREEILAYFSPSVLTHPPKHMTASPFMMLMDNKLFTAEVENWIEAYQQLSPWRVDMNWLDEGAYEDRDEFYIYIEPAGYVFTPEDDFDVENWSDEFLGGPVCVQFFLMNMGYLMDQEEYVRSVWEKHWFFRDIRVDFDLLFTGVYPPFVQVLFAHFEMDDFLFLDKLTHNYTGNYFLDYNPYDQYRGDLRLEISIETIRFLFEEWEQCQVLQAKEKEIDETLKQDPARRRFFIALMEIAAYKPEDVPDALFEEVGISRKEYYALIKKEKKVFNETDF